MKVSRYDAIHGDIVVHVIDQTHAGQGIITAFTSKRSTAELSDLGPSITIAGLKTPIYFFNRIKVQRKNEGTGQGKALMIEVCKLADQRGITIFNELNPYGKRDMDSLKEFFRASGFEDFGPTNTMVRKPKVNDELQ